MLLWQGNSTYDTEADKRRLRNIRHDNKQDMDSLYWANKKEIQEVKNAYEAYAQISVINPYDIEELKRIHAIMTKYLVDESGCFRHGEEGVVNGEQCIFMAPPARLVPQLIDELFAWMNRVQGEVHPLILASVFHYEFVFIHPFSDGNGRMARLWHTCLLSKWKSDRKVSG